MRRRWVWVGAVAGLAMLIVATAAIPDDKLRREIDAARREGLWITFVEMRRSLRGPGRNAAPLVEAENFRVSASPTATSNPAAWREISNCGYCEAEFIPRLDDPFLTSDTFHLTAGVEVLCAKARTGASPRENLLAAARIVRLIGREPSVGGLQWWAIYGRRTIEAAKEMRLAPEVAREMGPAPDWRWVLFAVLPAHLQVIERQHETVNRASFFRRFALSGPLGAYARLDVIHAYREGLRHLPADAAAVDLAKVKDVERTILIKVSTYAPSIAPAPFPGLTAASLKEVGRFESERRAALKGR